MTDQASSSMQAEGAEPPLLAVDNLRKHFPIKRLFLSFPSINCPKLISSCSPSVVHGMSKQISMVMVLDLLMMYG